MSLRDLKATDMVRVAAMHAEAQAEIVELRAERDALRAAFIDIKNFMMPDPCDDREPDAYKLMAGVQKIIAKSIAAKEGE